MRTSKEAQEFGNILAELRLAGVNEAVHNDWPVMISRKDSDSGEDAGRVTLAAAKRTDAESEAEAHAADDDEITSAVAFLAVPPYVPGPHIRVTVLRIPDEINKKELKGKLIVDRFMGGWESGRVAGR